MTNLKIRFNPIDSLFFRDGSPFDRGDLQANIQTVFPPSPTTLAGAIRAAWAKALGWDGKTNCSSNWERCCKPALGGGRDLAAIKFNGPYLLKGDTPIFPAPAHLLGVPPDNPQDTPQHLALLAPGAAMLTDLGNVQLPGLLQNDDIKGRKALIEDWWITAEGLTDILNGKLPQPQTLLHKSTLWNLEQRLGNYRQANRVTTANALYAPLHICLQPDVSILMYVANLDEKHIETIIRTPCPLGGESRACWLQIEEGTAEDFFHTTPEPTATTHPCLLALTPLQLQQPILPQVNLPFGEVISSCNPRSIMRGGWEKNGPLALKPHLAPGSVIFLHAETALQPLDCCTLGESSNWGFGHLVVGQTPALPQP